MIRRRDGGGGLRGRDGGPGGRPCAADGEVKIGEINSYSALPSFTEPYRKGWQLAVDEINAHGGIDGKTLVVISKDDAGKPGEALDGRQRARIARRRGHAGRRLLLQHRPGARRLRQAAQDRLPGRRTADGRARLVGGQPLHVPPAAFQLPCRPPCWPRRRRSCPPRPGPRSRRTTNTASRPWRCFKTLLRRPPPRRLLGGGAVADPGQDRRRPGGGPPSRQAQARRHPQRRVRPGPREAGPRGRHPRPLQGPQRGQLPHAASRNTSIP